MLRACERFGMRPGEFEGLGYDEQVRLLAYDQVRRGGVGVQARFFGRPGQLQMSSLKAEHQRGTNGLTRSVERVGE